MRFLKKIYFCFLASTCLFAGSPSSEVIYPTVVIGGGIGALTSSLYLARAGIKPLIIEGETQGGLLTQSHSVQNWPGEIEISGAELAEKMFTQVKANGGDSYSAIVTGVDFSKRPFLIQTKALDGTDREVTLKANTCIIAMGTKPNYLGVPGESGESGYWGRGVTNCAICDGSFYRNQTVGVVGGGDAAVLEALYLANIAKQVNVFVRKGNLRAQEKRRIEQLNSKSNVQIFYNTQVVEVKGNGSKVTGVTLQKAKGERVDFPLDGLFLAIGSTPNSEIFKGVLNLDSKGYIKVSSAQETSVKGVYAVGDIVDPIYKQAITAAGDGAKAAMELQQFIADQGFQQTPQKVANSQTIDAAMEASVIEISHLEQFHKELKAASGPVVIDFYATWCGPCKKISKIFETSAKRLKGKVRFLKVNIDHLGDLGESYEIRSIPTVLLLDESGSVKERKVGMGPVVEFLKGL